ncbi:MAG: hypothetical protein ACOY95_04670 [Pseudomonadota bacterium]
MHRLKTYALALVGLAFIFAFLALVGWVVYAFFQYISAVPKELGAALVAAVATVLVATLTVMVGRYYERKRELDALYRDKKTEIYDEFLKEFFTLFFGADEGNSKGAEKDLVPFLREFTRKLVLWSGPEVIEAFVAWKDHLAKGTPDAQSIFLTEAFLRAIRNDLRHTNKGLRKGFFARLFLREGNLFLAMAAENPKVTLATLAEAEKLVRAQSEKFDATERSH